MKADVYGFFRKVPGGMVLIPMLLTALINTCFPGIFVRMGGMTEALFRTGTLTLAALIMFATGTALKVGTLKDMLRICSCLTLTKLIISFGAGYLYIHFFGLDGILGINAIAFVACICSCNPGIYMGLIQDYGKQSDYGMFAILNILAMPAIPILIISTAAGKGFDIMEVFTILFPFFMGMLLGNMDEGLSKMFDALTPLALP